MKAKYKWKYTIVFRFDDEAKVWVGYCKEIDVYSQGRTKKEAAIATMGAVELKEKYVKENKNQSL